MLKYWSQWEKPYQISGNTEEEFPVLKCEHIGPFLFAVIEIFEMQWNQFIFVNNDTFYQADIAHNFELFSTLFTYVLRLPGNPNLSTKLKKVR